MSVSKFAAKFATLAIVGLTLAACAGSPDGMGPGPKEGTGTLHGAGTGAVLGAALDDEDKQRAYAAQMEALERGPSGAPVSWRNPDSGRYGSIVPGPAYQDAGRNCRSFTHTLYIDGRPETARGTACRNPDGTWTSIG